MILLSKTNFPGTPFKSMIFGTLLFVEYKIFTFVVGLKSIAFVI